MTSIRLVIADDQATVRESLAIVLGLVADFEVVATAADGQQALDAVEAHQPDVVVMDLHMPLVDGVAATGRITAEHPGVAVLVLTTYADDASVLAALRAGARGYLTKDAGRDQLTQAIRTAAAGQSVLDPEVQKTLLSAADRAVETSPAGGTGQRSDPSPDRAGLTQREREVLRLIAAGRSNAEIAAELVLSPATVKTHINNLFAKIAVRDRAQAVRYAFDHGLAG